MRVNGSRFTSSIFFTATMMVALFTLCFGIYEYRREHVFRCDILHAKLQLNNYTWSDSDIRLTVIDTLGNVLYDTQEQDVSRMGNHLHRKEVLNALEHGTGYDIKRTSETNGEKYFYSATVVRQPLSGIIGNNVNIRTQRRMQLPDVLIVRSAVPYSAPLTESLEKDYTFFYYTVGIFLLIAVVLYLRHRLEHSEREKNRIKRQLTENAAHELKTPAATIEGYLETLTSNPDMPQERRNDFIAKCHKQSVRMSQLLADMSMLTRLDEARIQRASTQVDVVDILRQIADETANGFHEKGMQLRLHIPESLPMRGDSSLIYSMLRNIFDNAMAYATNATALDVTAEVRKGVGANSMTFTIADDGIGVPHEHLRHIFERFYRLDKGRSRRLGGTGLGLAIVKNIALQYGGKAYAKQTPGGGLTVIVEISCA